MKPIKGIIWLKNYVDKLLWKHNITPDEVEDVFDNSPKYRFIEKGDVDGENLYSALGQTDNGRYLIIFFIYKLTGDALIISARDMTKKEKRSYAKKQ